jgi:hypothetical protein
MATSGSYVREVLRNPKVSDELVADRVMGEITELRGVRAQLEEQIAWCDEHGQQHLKQAYETARLETGLRYDWLLKLIS